MHLLDEIRRDHRLIDRVAGSMVAWADRGVDHPEGAHDLDELVGFLRAFVVGYHHRQEEVLFGALVDHAEVPAASGPLVVLRREHESLANAVEELASAGPCSQAAELARSLAAALWQHLDKEDSVLLLESERRLVDGGIRELPDVPADTRVEAARRAGDELSSRLPPAVHPDLIRGEGCIACAAFAEDCHGIESEWWSDWDRLHHASLDEG
jgi:hemerythrin-like domain-containing protein